MRRSRATAAADTLADLATDTNPGTRLGTKSELRALCGVSVGTFNEALKLAELRGTISLRPGPGGGVFTAEPSPMVRLGSSMLALDRDRTSVEEAVRIRDALDRLLVEDALVHATPAHFRSLRLHIEQMEDSVHADDSLGFIRANWHLHRVIASTSPHVMLRTLYFHLLDLIENHTLAVQPAAGESLPAFIAARHQLHVDLVDAIESKDRTSALRLIEEHNTTAAHDATASSPADDATVQDG